ncbi:MAG: CPBP family intramembrane metalloprotease [Armatimonadetes bacterium]|nr:CPBP family intramembrane metalloprotease [Armatimonadota bacterium]
MENTESPPIIDPAEPEVPAARATGGWLFLIILFVLTALAQIFFYFNPNPDKSFGHEKTQVINGTKIGRDVERPDFKAIVKKVGAAKDKDKFAAKIYLIARYESDRKPIPRMEQGMIAKNPDAESKALSALYLAEKLTPADAAKLASQLPVTDKLNTVIRSHAYRKAGETQKADALLRVDESNFANYGKVACLTIWLSFAVWITYFQKRAAGLWGPLGFSSHPMSLLEADTAGLRVALGLLITFYVAPIMVLGLPLTKDGSQAVAYGLMVAGVAGILGLTLHGKRINVARFFGRVKPAAGVGWVVGTYFAMIPVMAVCLSISVLLQKVLPDSTHPLSEELSRNPSALIKGLISAAIIAPIIEETLFRGLLFPALSRIFNSPWKGGIISSCMFAMMHPQGLPAWPALAVLGGAFAFLTYQTRSLYPAMLLHCIHNGLLVLLAVNFA